MTTIQSKTTPTSDLGRTIMLGDLARRLALADADELRVVERVLERLEIRRGRDIIDDLADELVNRVADELGMEDAEVARKRAEALEQIVPVSAPPETEAVDPSWQVW